eukprot:sb/3473283/
MQFAIYQSQPFKITQYLVPTSRGSCAGNAKSAAVCQHCNYRGENFAQDNDTDDRRIQQYHLSQAPSWRSARYSRTKPLLTKRGCVPSNQTGDGYRCEDFKKAEEANDPNSELKSCDIYYCNERYNCDNGAGSTWLAGILLALPLFFCHSVLIH